MTMQFSHCWCTSNYNWTGGLALMSWTTALAQ